MNDGFVPINERPLKTRKYMKYRIVQTRVVEIDEAKDYTEKELRDHRRANPTTTKVVWHGDREENFEKRFSEDRRWPTGAHWPTSSRSGWVCYSYALERLDEISQNWRLICFVTPVAA